MARIEANHLIPHMRSVAAIAHAMDIDPNELLDDVRLS
ncbi:hypothetical protein C5C27_09560 [Rathayibacter sp. AY2B7]|nr:hypothetical protein C5C27_09560 [Rathayibacter sp. AY2B7]